MSDGEASAWVSDDRDNGPPLVGSAAAAIAATGAVALAGISTPLSLPVGLFGLLALITGLLRSSRRLLDGGALLVFVCVLASALAGAPAAPIALATVGVIVAWDVSHRAVGLGEQLGKDAGTARLELVHVAVSLLIGLGTAVAVAVVFAVSTGGLPVAVLVLLVIAGALLVIGLGTRGELYGAPNPGED